DIIWRMARVVGFSFRLFSPSVVADANRALFDLLARGALRPSIAATFPLAAAAEAQRTLIEGRPYGRVLLEICRSARSGSVAVPSDSSSVTARSAATSRAMSAARRRAARAKGGSSRRRTTARRIAAADADGGSRRPAPDSTMRTALSG